MSTSTRTSFLDSVTMRTNESMVKSKLPWYEQIYRYFQRLYMQFLLVTTLYVMEPWERLLIISIFVFLLSLVTYSAFVYIPFHLHHLIQSTIPKLSAVIMR